MKKVLILSYLVFLILCACSKNTTYSSQTISPAAEKVSKNQGEQVMIAEEAHSHGFFEGDNTVEHDFFGYCGNTMTKISDKNGIISEFWGGYSVEVTDLLRYLNYNQSSCDCISEYIIDTEFGLGYQVSITEKFARHDGMQVSLTDEQVEIITSAIEYAKTIE